MDIRKSGCVLRDIYCNRDSKKLGGKKPQNNQPDKKTSHNYLSFLTGLRKIVVYKVT